MKIRTTIVTFCLSMLFLASYSQTTRLYGRVINLDNRPVEYAIITLTSSKTTTVLADENGQFASATLRADTTFLSATGMGYNQADTILYLKYTDSNWVVLRLSINKPDTSTKEVWIGFGSERASADIKNKYLRILLPSGLVIHKFPGDEDFEKKYNVVFYNQCRYIDQRSIAAYNKVVFKYLDKTLGKTWRRDVRQDLIGLKR